VVGVQRHHQPGHAGPQHRVDGAPRDAVDVAVHLGAHREAGRPQRAERVVGRAELHVRRQLGHVEVTTGDGDPPLGREATEPVGYRPRVVGEGAQHRPGDLERPPEHARGVGLAQPDHLAHDPSVLVVDDARAVGVTDVVVGRSDEQDFPDRRHVWPFECGIVVIPDPTLPRPISQGHDVF
jgi:hypothetical protein